MQKWAVFHLICKQSLNIYFLYIFLWIFIINEFEKFVYRRVLKALDFLCSFNASTTWNTAGIKVLSLLKVALMVGLFTWGWEDRGKRRINGRIDIK